MADVSQTMVHGLAPVLETLRTLDRELYRAVQNEIRTQTDDLRVAVAAGFPDKPWDSPKPVNWLKYGRTKRGRKMPDQAGASFPRYDPGKVKAGVKIVVGGRKVRRTNSFPILRVVQSNGAGEIFDLAKDGHGKAGTQFVKNLAKSGEPSRVMWKKVRANYPLVEGKVTVIVDRLMKQFSAQIAHESDRRAAQSVRASQQVRNVLGQFGARVL